MHIVECYFESGGFDFNLLKGGISVYMWNLSRQFVAAGHRVSIITATNGRLDYLASHYQLETVDYRHAYRLPLVLDPLVWEGQSEVEVPLETSVYKMTLEGIDVYFLDNEMLRLYPDTCYPPYQSKGSDIGFYKPLAFQVDCIKFIQKHCVGQPLLIHAHEPYYQYLMPFAFRDDPDRIMVSTVQSNMPVNKKVYKPKVARLLALLGIEADLDQFDDRLDRSDPLLRCMEQHLPASHLYYPYRDDYLNLLAPIVAYSDYVDFLSPGQLRFYTSFADTPFEQLFGQLAIAKVLAEHRSKLFVGWCAISDSWHQFDPASVARDDVLRGLGLDPANPTFYHNARYAVEHKGQVELMRAIEQALERDPKLNFIVRCISGTGIDNPYFHQVKARFPANIYLDWSMVSEQTLMQYASAADFSLFPSKFEMDTFLIAQGESMLCGAVPIATAQEGTSHFEHALPVTHPRATGLAVNRSFAEDDPLLAQALAERIIEAAALYRHDQPCYRKLVRNARAVASQFTWEMAARAHLDVFERAEAERLARHADTEAPAARAAQQFEQAYARADFDACAALAGHLDAPALSERLARRFSVASNTVSYRHEHVRGVELFARFDAGVDRFECVPMQANGAQFEVALPQQPVERELYFRLTLANGRVCWDRSGHA